MKEPEDLVRKQILLTPTQINFLEERGDLSAEARKIIDATIQQRKNEIFERYLIIFAVGLMFIAIATIITVSFIMAAVMAIGVAYIIYSVLATILWRVRHA